jgi:hypothetical protein
MHWVDLGGLYRSWMTVAIMEFLSPGGVDGDGVGLPGVDNMKHQLLQWHDGN